MKLAVKFVSPLLLAVMAGCATTDIQAPAAVAPVVEDPAKVAENQCRSAVATNANRPIDDTAILSVETTRVGSAMKISLKGADRPWSCIVDSKGVVSNVMYMGEG